MMHNLLATRVAILLAVCAFCSTGYPAGALETGTSPQGGADAMPVVPLSSVPQVEPVPPLTYQLVPSYSQLTPGNAATNYYRAIVMLPHDEQHQFDEQQFQWLEVPLAEFPRDEARKWLKAYGNALNEVHTATCHEDCDWGYRLRELEGLEIVSFLLPELAEVRTIARVLRLQSRVEIADGRFEDALRTITTGYRLGENVARTPILVSALVGVAIIGQMNASVLDWIEAGGPNLYWALAGLPDPLVDVRLAVQQESYLPVQICPILDDPEHATHTAEEWRRLLGQSIQQLEQMTNSGNESSHLRSETIATGLLLVGYSTAKQELIDSGMDAAQVEAMPVAQVVAILSARAYQTTYQELMKWTLLPYWQSYRQMRATSADLRRRGLLGTTSHQPVLPVANLLMPAVDLAVFAPVRMQREIAALQTIEALRMFAASHDGQFPQSLEQLQQCPAPWDPVTGTFIDYRLQDGAAVLTLPPPEGQSPRNEGKRYELRFRQPSGQ
ncbi:MAG: hypothetical protein GXY58_17750 [Planctomycetaceae bacterium]|nr:hypothetical protein [Planctomycetaceae bacterium]